MDLFRKMVQSFDALCSCARVSRRLSVCQSIQMLSINVFVIFVKFVFSKDEIKVDPVKKKKNRQRESYLAPSPY